MYVSRLLPETFVETDSLRLSVAILAVMISRCENKFGSEVCASLFASAILFQWTSVVCSCSSGGCACARSL